jgi:hypothetical protein
MRLGVFSGAVGATWTQEAQTLAWLGVAADAERRTEGVAIWSPTPYKATTENPDPH